MRVKIIFDKAALDKRFHAGWGLSVLVEDKILFDTGEKGSWLIENLKNAGADISAVKSVVISHDHWDHTGGLWDVLGMRAELVVYACPGFGPEFKRKVKESNGRLIEAKRTTEISENVFVTGEIPGEYKGRYMPEQAVVLKTKKGITLITGCSHPGIVTIIEKAKQAFLGDKLYLVLGGFHLLDSDKRTIYSAVRSLAAMGVEKAAPAHCSGPEAEEVFREVYGQNFVPVKIGRELNV